MGRFNKKEVIAFARKILRTYFVESRLDFLISTFDDDIIWLGGGRTQKAEGKEDVANWFISGKDDMFPCVMENEDYQYMRLGDDYHMVEGVSDLYTSDNTEHIMFASQRITFIFKEEDRKLKTVHIHNSIPFDELKDEELFPVEYSKEQYDLLHEAYENKLSEIDSANEAIKNQAMLLNRLYQSVPSGILQLECEYPHNIIIANHKIGQIYGIDEKDIKSGNYYNLLYKKIIESEDNISKVLHNGGVIDYEREIIKYNKEKAWISVHLDVLNDVGGNDVIQCVINDITKQKHALIEKENEQKLENSLLRSAIFSSNEAILNLNLTADTYSIITSLEEVESDYRNIPRSGRYDDLIDKSCDLMVHPDYKEEYRIKFDRQNVIKQFKSGKKEIYMELMELGEDNEYHWKSYTFTRAENIYNEDIIGISIVKSLDKQRSERIRSEQLLKDALNAARTANEAKSDFLSRMSHDIRTPLNAIIGMSTIGKLKIEKPNSVLDCFSKIDSSSKYLLSLINDILDMSKIESGKVTLNDERFVFSEMIHEINEIIYDQAKEKGIEYKVYSDINMDKYYIADRLKLNQIFMNLLSNSLKYSSKGDFIHFSFKEVKRERSVSLVEFIVEDSGCGMSKGFLDKLFLPFEQENAGVARNNVGTGLGLTIVKNIVDIMEGNIEVISEKGRGSKFIVTLPLGIIESEEEAEYRKKKELLKGLNVLIADDDEIVAKQIEVIMNDIGAKAVKVNSGSAAVDEVKRKYENDEFFDVCFIDWKMPDMNGIETTGNIRKIVGEDTTIIIITAYDWSVIEDEGRRAGVNHFISKPVFEHTICDYLTDIDVKHIRHIHKKSAKSLMGRNVLLVEDNILNQEIARSILEMRGMNVDTAENGKEAVDKFISSDIGYYDMILMDIRMPVMDGIEATKAIRSSSHNRAEDIPIIAVSANAFEEDKIKAFDAGINGYLIKPFDAENMMDMIEKFLN